MSVNDVNKYIVSFTILMLLLPVRRNLYGQALVANLDKYFLIQEEKEPLNGVILIQKTGKTIFEKAFGYASVEFNLKNTLQTKFSIASVTKPFIATLIFILEQKGLLSVKDKISKYLPQVPDSGQDISIEHLLTHTSGIADYLAQPNYDTLKHLETTNDQLLNKIIRLPLKSKAGESYEYSNSNYVLLACIIEKITLSSVDSALQKEICKPLGMKNTFFPDPKIPVKELASGYFWQEKLYKADHINFSTLSGAGGIISTASDLSIFLNAIMKYRILPEDVVKKMTTPVHEDYGSGWISMPFNHHHLIGHLGRIEEGYYAHMWYEPKTEISVVYLSNVHNGTFNVVSNIFNILLNTSGSSVYKMYAEFPPSVPYQIPASSLDEFTGSYSFRDQVLNITKADNKLYIKADKENGKTEMIPYNLSKFWVGGPANITVTFIRDTLSQKITQAEIILNGTPITATKKYSK